MQLQHFSWGQRVKVALYVTFLKLIYHLQPAAMPLSFMLSLLSYVSLVRRVALSRTRGEEPSSPGRTVSSSEVSECLGMVR